REEESALEREFPDGVDTDLLQKILSDGPVPLERKVPAIDPELAAIVRKALEPDATRRYRDAMALRQDLTRVRRRLAETEQFATGDAVRKTALYETPTPT